MTVADYVAKFSKLRVNTRGGHSSPHKICMLLAMLDMTRSGSLKENRIAFGPALLERYNSYFEKVRSPVDQSNPHLPFFHLKGDLTNGENSFWHLLPNPGKEESIQKMGRSISHKSVQDNILAATIDQELFELIQDQKNVDRLTKALETLLTPENVDAIKRQVRIERTIGANERAIRGLSEPKPLKMRQQSVVARDCAFRRVIIEAYNYTCAATRKRIVLNDGRAMVEAAHIRPFSQARDNSPRNGIALTPDMHWAMDRNLIAPGEDMKWHVSALRLDRSNPAHADLINFDNQPILLPDDPRLHPDPEACKWRMEALRKGIEIAP